MISNIDEAYQTTGGIVPLAEFKRLAKKKVEDMNGMVDEVTAALIVASELGGNVSKEAAKAMPKPAQQTIVDPMTKIGEITEGKDISFVGVILSVQEPRTYSKKDGGNGMRASMVVGDETGKIRISLWDERAVDVSNMKLGIGDTVEILRAYAKPYNGNMEANLGYRGEIRPSDKVIKYKAKTTPIADISPDSVVSVTGSVTGVDGLREFLKKDGTAGRVCGIWLSDDTGRIRVSFWDEYAEMAESAAIGSKITIYDARAKAGYKGDVELRANGGFIVE